MRRWLPHRLTTAVTSLALTASAPAGTPEDHRSTVQRFVEINNSREYDRLDEIVNADFVRHSQSTPGVEVKSLADFKAFLAEDANTFPDSRVELTSLVAEADHVAFLGHFTATQKGPMGPFPATNRSVRIDVSGMFRFKDGKISELWILWDNMAVLSQLQLLEVPPGEGH